MPTIPRNRGSAWFQKRNHIALPPKEVTKAGITEVGQSYAADRGQVIAVDINGERPAQQNGRERAVSTNPGLVEFAGTSVSEATQALKVGRTYRIEYVIEDIIGTAGLFFNSATCAFNGAGPAPSALGLNTVDVVATNKETAALIRKSGSGSIEFSSFSCRELFTDGTGALYVSDTLGEGINDGSWASPVSTVEEACALASAGDTIIVLPGIYDPFDISCAGTSDLPITITTEPGYERTAFIRGNLLSHETFIGSGAPQTAATRNGIDCEGQSYVEIEYLDIGMVWGDGIRILGDGVGTVTDGNIIRGCHIANVGGYGILCAGADPSSAVDGTDAYRLTNMLIEHNTVTQTNVITDFNIDSGNNDGRGGGRVEGITLANSVNGAIIRYNHLYNSLQYGIDCKNHVINVLIEHNLIEDIARHGVYLDAGQSNVQSISVRYNTILRCNQGIVLAREERGDDAGDQLILLDIAIHSNIIAYCDRPAILLQKHPDDNQDVGQYASITIAFNTMYDNAKDTAQSYQHFNVGDIADFGNRVSDGQPVVTDIVVAGNLLWSASGDLRCDIPSADARFTVAYNINMQNGSFTGTDPGFTDVANLDFTLSGGSIAENVVIGATAGEFGTDAAGNTRADPSDAGALEIV